MLHNNPQPNLGKKRRHLFLLTTGLVLICVYTVNAKKGDSFRETKSKVVVSENQNEDGAQDRVSQKEPKGQEEKVEDTLMENEDQIKPSAKPVESQPAAKKYVAKAVPKKVVSLPVKENTPSAVSKPMVSNKTPDNQLVEATQISIDEIVSLINSERAKNNLQTVKLNSLLNQAAYDKSKHMADNDYFAHTAPDGTKDSYFVNQVGYKYQAIGFNLAKGDFGSSKGLVDGWMNSEGHKANILASFGREIGIGIYGQYFTMMIAQPQ